MRKLWKLWKHTRKYDGKELSGKDGNVRGKIGKRWRRTSTSSSHFLSAFSDASCADRASKTCASRCRADCCAFSSVIMSFSVVCCVSSPTHVHTYTHTNIYTRTRTRTQTQTHRHKHPRTLGKCFVFASVHTSSCLHRCIYPIHPAIYICNFICVHIHPSIHIDTCFVRR